MTLPLKEAWSCPRCFVLYVREIEGCAVCDYGFELNKLEVQP